jgi:hypothetical protein
VCCSHWDWTIRRLALLLADYLGPTAMLSGDQVTGFRGGSAWHGVNATPSGVVSGRTDGLHLHSSFGPSWEGLRRNIGAAAASQHCVAKPALDKADWLRFKRFDRLALFSPRAAQRLHWWGALASHMSSVGSRATRCSIFTTANRPVVGDGRWMD